MKNNQAPFVEREWQTEDGLTLYCRDYPGGSPGRPALLCLHGLTRNARDFEEFAARLAGHWRLIVPDMRGRGKSEYARTSASYELGVYVADVAALLRDLDPGPIAIVGTSMGGLMAMIMAQSQDWRVAGALINDVGPEIDAAGLARLRENVGQGGTFETWMHAARHLRDANGSAHPGYALTDWLGMAKRVMCIGGSGRIAFDYDMRIADSLAEGALGGAIDLWPAWRLLAAAPTLVLRGERSDILSAPTLARMVAEGPRVSAVTVPEVGHAPTLGEPEAVAAIDRWLETLGE